ncbi:MAG: DegT/DnrJ/EryC1/StrS family aminotransferase [Planctomycetota bacterium]
MAASVTVPFLDLKPQIEKLQGELESMFRRVIMSARFAEGPEATAFEQEFASTLTVEHVVGCSSGTAALRLALEALGLKRGDEVITVPNTFIATTEAISQAGGTVVFCDVDPRRGTMDPEQLRNTITPRTFAIVPVHLYGRPADMDPILQIAHQHNLRVVEDACQAHGARYKGRPAGSMGHAGCFSFYPGKNIGAFGEAGCVATNDGAVARAVRLLKDHGQPQKYHHVVEGDNARLDAIQAGVLRIKLRYLEQWNERRREIAALYRELLGSIDGIEVPGHDPALLESYHLYVIHTPHRDRLRAELEQAGIQTALHYPIPLHLQPAYARLGYRKGSFPVAERLAAQLLSLPVYPELDDASVAAVCREITRIMEEIRQEKAPDRHAAVTAG